MAQNDTTGKQGRYEILLNAKGEILIIIQSGSGGAEEPLFIYDGGPLAVLYRNDDNVIYLKDIPDQARAPLKSVLDLQVVELENDEVIREYASPVRIVKDVASLCE